ncbi:MAG TPA: septum formation initiator family protein [Mycobacterium sp.]|nr:septum formation initiator family protein [Mycobacterium sp.]
MSDPKRADPKRRFTASRPGRGGGTGRAHPRRPSGWRRDSIASRVSPASVVQPIKRSISAMAARQSELRVGFTARRAVILAAVMCVLTLTIAGPVRTFFAQHAEMKQQAVIEATLRQQIADLQQHKANLEDPAHIKAQARERLGFVMPGEIPYQVQLPGIAGAPGRPGAQPMTTPSGDPWYTALWHTIADTPHGPPPPQVPPAPLPTGG